MPYPTSSRPILSNARRDSAHRGCTTKIKEKSVRAYSPPGTGGGCAIKQNAAQPPLMAPTGVVDFGECFEGPPVVRKNEIRPDVERDSSHAAVLSNLYSW